MSLTSDRETLLTDVHVLNICTRILNRQHFYLSHIHTCTNRR